MDQVSAADGSGMVRRPVLSRALFSEGPGYPVYCWGEIDSAAGVAQNPG